MSRIAPTLTCLSLLALAPLAATASAPQKLEECVTLSGNHSAARAGSTGLVVQDGDNHYQLDFGGSCSATTLASQVTITTAGQANTICPRGSAVTTRTHYCRVRSAVLIPAETYQRYARRR